MRHILSIAIVLCLLVLIGIFFLSDPDTVPTEPAFDMNHAQTMSNHSGDMDMHDDMNTSDMHEAMDEEMESDMDASDMDMDAMPMEDESEMEDPMMEEEGEAAM